LAHTKIKTLIVTVNPLRMLCRGAFYSSSRIGALCRNNTDQISAIRMSLDSFALTEQTFRVREKKMHNAEIYTGAEPNTLSSKSSGQKWFVSFRYKSLRHDWYTGDDKKYILNPEDVSIGRLFLFVFTYMVL
jgi:hypothetical protein